MALMPRKVVLKRLVLASHHQMLTLNVKSMKLQDLLQ
jgi:hypothetical protein